MPAAWSFSQQGALGGGGELSPGQNSTGFTSNQVITANSSGQLRSLNSTAMVLAFFGVAGSTMAPAYTTAAVTTGRVWVSTASISTFTGVSGAGAGFTSRADMEAFVQATIQMYLDLRAYGILR